MTTTRKRYSAKFKARVALEAIRGEKTLSQLGSQFQVHPVQVAHWRKAALEQLQESFVDGRSRKAREDEFDPEAMYELDRPAEDGAGLGEKKSWHARMTIGATGWNRNIRQSACGGSVPGWGSAGGACITSRSKGARKISG
jgi:transposase